MTEEKRDEELSVPTQMALEALKRRKPGETRLNVGAASRDLTKAQKAQAAERREWPTRWH